MRAMHPIGAMVKYHIKFHILWSAHLLSRHATLKTILCGRPTSVLMECNGTANLGFGNSYMVDIWDISTIHILIISLHGIRGGVYFRPLGMPTDADEV